MNKKNRKEQFLEMLLGTLGASRQVTGKGTIHPLTSLKYKNIIKMNLNLIVFIQETIYLN